MNNDIDFLINALDEFGIISAGDDLIRDINRGELIEDFGSIKVPENESDKTLGKIESILLKYAKSPNESDFWSILRDRIIPPTYIEVLCLYLVSNEQFFTYGAKIYSILLGMEPCSKIWCPMLFAPILKTLITTQQILENGAQLNAQTKSQLNLTVSLLSNLAKAFSDNFANMIGDEVLIALSEIIMKLMLGFRVELDLYNDSIAKEARKIAEKIAKTNLDYLLTFIVPELLLGFAPNANSLTARIEKLRDRILDFTMSQLTPSDDRIVLICKHMMMRVPEKVHIKKSTAAIVYKLTKYSINSKQIIYFVLKLGKAAKINLRSFSSYLLQLYLVNISDLSPLFGDEAPEIVMQMANTIKNQLTDSAPTVRASSLDAVSSIIENLENNSFGIVIKNVIDSKGTLQSIFQKRIVDEKLVVRRAALQCLTQIVMSNARAISPVMIEMIASRVRDRAVSIRNMAVKSLCTAHSRFSDNKALNRAFIDSILPLILDTENSVQKEAFDAANNHIIGPLINGNDDEVQYFLPKMQVYHFNFMKDIFTYSKQKAISLKNTARALVKIAIRETDNIPVWKLVEKLTEVETSHFKVKEFYDLWNDKNSLPSEYFAILANLGCKSEEIKNDCIQMIGEEASQNSKKYGFITNLLQLLKIQDGSDNVWPDFISRYCTAINQCVQSTNINEIDLYNISTMIYVLGDVILASSKQKILNDYDFTGIKLLITEKLPNDVEIPNSVSALAVIALGKLCLAVKTVSNSFVSAFAHLLSSNTAGVAIKCNCLVVLCDLCVQYSAIVDPHIQLMTNCFADPSKIVRNQTIHIVTKLIVEDYLRMSSILFFRYIHAITDEDPSVSTFACNCLFNVILSKHENLIKEHFLEAILYFSREISLDTFTEIDSEKEKFQITDKSRRHLAYALMISRLDAVTSFKMVELLCQNVLNKFVKGEYSISKHSVILEDSIYSMIELEDKMKMSLEIEAISDNSVPDKIYESTKKVLTDIHNSMIRSVLPTLNSLHRLLREGNSPLQGQLKKFYQRVISKNKSLMDIIQKTEPILAIELQNEMEADAQEPDNDENETISEIPSTPKKVSFLFESQLLTKIATTPRSMLCTPKRGETNSNENSTNEQICVTPPRNQGVREFSTPPHDTSLLD
ncbi:hypothetical protein TRFO_05935 [Tritrichomonas foetus]|uniref:Condensin complex subunit 1 C-terminal domain-containing protein n=1 Tax=Tritrichomonas foetus TaxID=1144522 RepID=A0A1J4K6M2_9EUKA|nr:hypothetical protein TRFO_05935 [Tritrichomonas foetus]|eukprot:OHT05358.1 hypothetical protein TRFO_05935 [Tritrichomonas foetus]